MKKKTLRCIAVIGTAMLIGLTVGCQKNEEETSKVTITFMNGDETLGEATANAGEVLKESDYSAFEKVDDAEFTGWFETPGFLETSKKDLTTDTFSKDTTLYGCFRSDNVAEDTRVWYIVGESAGILNDSAWAGSSVDEATKEIFELKDTGKATNEVSVTIDLYEGDMFQIIHDWAWDGQKGYGCFTEIDENDFASAGGLGGTSETSNVLVNTSGNYTITLKTDPDNSSMDTMTIVRNGDATVEAAGGDDEETEAYVPTETTAVKVKGSWVADWSDIKDLTKADGSYTYTITMELDAETELCFSVFDGDTDSGVVLKEGNVTDAASLAFLTSTGNNIKVTESGSYTFTVDMEAMTVTITK